jgi:hypothetical protein
MLKLIYSELGLKGEHVAESLEDWMVQRSVFALRVGQPFNIEPGRAAFLVSIEHPVFDVLVEQLLLEKAMPIEICTVDQDYVEISLSGSWIATSDHEGLFITALGDRTEFLISQVWEMAQTAKI